jgi:hypothetical protein
LASGLKIVEEIFDVMTPHLNPPPQGGRREKENPPLEGRGSSLGCLSLPEKRSS